MLWFVQHPSADNIWPLSVTLNCKEWALYATHHLIKVDIYGKQFENPSQINKVIAGTRSIYMIIIFNLRVWSKPLR